ncbi:tetratricopeptide repeat protein [Mucilaginibacter sp. 14171R-50]|uniref:tetratricopeptide repeat protein n=1 Tax=Mucilaginibacter sp. 14171R-50 TaxID=2703789 RepID=UPI00138B8B3B|nr:tetratricopeptide repeat protein [Mucilaginibacter sp. 14171R-50]QHS55152.1 tetratricopeptide repeat protein [Mucilaginibacter sp. 14171R-50]
MKLKYRLSLIIALFISTIAYGQNKTDATTLVKQGIALHNEGKYTEAIQKYQEAIKIDPDNRQGLYQLAYTLFTSGKGKEAVPYLEKVIRLDPDSPGAYDMLGSIYDDDNQTEKALDYYMKGIKVAPNYQRLYYNLAIMQYRQGKYPEAEASIINAIKLDPRHASSQRVYALVAKQQNKLGNSLLSWCSFLLIEPQTKRSAEAMAYIKAIINYAIKRNTDKNITVTLNQNNTNPVGLMMPLAVINATAGKTNLSPVDSLTLQLSSLFQVAPSIISDKDQPFASKFLAGYFEALGKSGNMPAFVRFLSISAYPDENKKWITEHDKEFTALSNWATSTKREF